MSDHWLIDLLVGNWFDRAVSSYLENRMEPKPQRPKVYLDSAGNRIDPPDPEVP